MPSRKRPASPVKPEDVQPQEMTQEEMDAAQALPEGEAVAVPPPTDADAPASEHLVQCKYAHDPSDKNCKDCDGWDPIGEVREDGTCIGYEEGPAPEDWTAFNAEQQAALPETGGTAPSLRDDVLAAVGTGEAVTATIQAEIGITEQIKTANGTDVWIKANFSEVRRLVPDSDIEAERAALWADVQNEVQQQIEQIGRAHV